MTLRAELTAWRRKLAYRRWRWHIAARHHDTLAMAKWQRLADEAEHRTRQIEGELHHRLPVTMYDSTDLSQYPAELEAFATYIDGDPGFQHFDSLHAQHPRAKFITLAVFASTDAGTGLDVEPRNANPSEAPGWVRKRHARGIKRPWLYADRSEMGEVVTALTDDYIPREQYRLWLADPTGRPHIPNGFDACQYDWSAFGRNLDASLVKPGLL